ncbi:MAG TPA: 23S rRNA (pseudouridine(1915)-N(3))-methyltransferase RlmH [Lachnospiraceae bacterium]|nr:23S rRNA (pseudouridine(1915)-N(3))-methyltransferase RlmH [Lachnospiraceae bacterium]
MKITILCVGKIKEDYLRAAVAEYEKRLGRYATIEIIEVDDEKTSDKSSEREDELIREREGERLLRHIPDQAYVVALAIGGKEYSSVEFADKIEKLGVDGVSHIVFIIGGSIGLSTEVLGAADDRVSFSRMTFPHQLMRVILLEQIYRAARIIRGEPYHK